MIIYCREASCRLHTLFQTELRRELLGRRCPHGISIFRPPRQLLQFDRLTQLYLHNYMNLIRWAYYVHTMNVSTPTRRNSYRYRPDDTYTGTILLFSPEHMFPTWVSVLNLQQLVSLWRLL